MKKRPTKNSNVESSSKSSSRKQSSRPTVKKTSKTTKIDLSNKKSPRQPLSETTVGPATVDRPFRILSIDGGGIRGAFSAAILDYYEMRLKDANKGRIVDYFDLIVGTSTGALIALGLAVEMSPKDLMQFYEQKGSTIFPERNWGERFKSIFATKYDSGRLRHVISEVFGRTKMRDLRYRVAIPAFDGLRGGPKVFKSPYLQRLGSLYESTLVEVALATTAAPTYFSAAKSDLGLMIDGGVWANCPVLIGIAEAIKEFNRPPADIQVLSLGTTNRNFVLSERHHNGGDIQWAAEAPDLLMQASKLGTLEVAQRLCRDLIRVDDDVQGQYNMGDSTKVPMLIHLGRSAGERSFQTVNSTIFTEFADRAKLYLEPPFAGEHI